MKVGMEKQTPKPKFRRKKPHLLDDKRFLIGCVLSIILAACGWVVSWYVGSPAATSIINAQNNAGIVVHGQTGNNIINNNNLTLPLHPKLCTDLVDATGTYFPAGAPKPTIFRSLTDDELREKAHTITVALKELAANYSAKADSIRRDEGTGFTQRESKLGQLDQHETSAFRAGLLQQAGDLHFALLDKLRLPWPVCSTSGLSVEGYKAIAEGLIADDGGLQNLSGYLQRLAKELP